MRVLWVYLSYKKSGYQALLAKESKDKTKNAFNHVKAYIKFLINQYRYF